MSEQLLTILKLCLLALLYLFFFRVLRAVWAELRAPVTPATASPVAPQAPRASVPAPMPAAPPPPRGRGKRAQPTELLALAPPERAGTVYPIAGELTVGRAGGCAIALPEDTYVSSLHARVFVADGQVLVEDLGSTNGTFLNQAKVTAAVPLKKGDRLQVGNTALEAR